ncbi:MAG: rod shape-determining protein MreC [Anaerolineales bacterium]|nr:rod shape-determining protein MreC [Anaerolineales bacterium]
MRDFFSRTLQTTIVFLVIGGVMALALGGFFGSASNLFSGSMVSVQDWMSSRYIAIQEFLRAPRDMVVLRQRNAELEAEISRLQTQMIELQQQVAETQILSALVDFSRANPENTYMAAAVIGRDPSPFLHYVIINRGSSDGVLSGMPVVTNQGLVGRIDAVIADAARVQLITDPGSVVNIRLQNSETEALLAGSVTGDLALEMIPQDITIEPNDIVLTSGLGGGFPPDLIVGQVQNVRQRDYELFQIASVQTVVDFSRLEIVLVITNFRPVDIAPLAPETTP